MSLGDYTGVISYEPSELVLTAAAGTSLVEIESLLEQHNQCLPFQPPCFDPRSSIGGAIASGLSGPARPWSGALRDYVLGISCINGRGEQLNFGGQVIKNVAGYDVSRLLTGSLGTLAVILEISIKVLPKPEFEKALIDSMPLHEAVEFINSWNVKAVPISGISYYQGQLRVRLSGYESAVLKTSQEMGLQDDPDPGFWHALRHQTLDFFATEEKLWRVSLPPSEIEFEMQGERLIDWAGGLHWIKTQQAAESLRSTVASLGGHATLYRSDEDIIGRFHPLNTLHMKYHKNIKQAFDPAGIFNPGIMYKDM